MTEKTLASIVSVSRRFQRSTKIDADYNSPEALSGFVLQTSGLNAVNTIADFYQKSTQRAFTLTGPYGSGKSSLALFFSSLLTGSDPVRAEALSILKAAPEAAESGLAAFGKEKPWRFVSLLGHRASLADDFLKAIHAEGEDVRTAIDALVAGTKTGDGVLLIIDELGKYLENGNSDNCYFLQELAEAVNRSDSRIIVLGILHQAFSAYAADLSKLERDEWAKVQGRFVDIPLLAGPDEILQLLCRSIVSAERPEIEGLEACVDLVVNELAKNCPVDKPAVRETLLKVWPLNPVAASLLGPLSRRPFLQNNRSVFNFLTSVEPLSFTNFLASEPLEKTARMYSPCDLWDYLEANFEQAILSSPADSHRWTLASDCVERAERTQDEELVRIVKTVALLDLFKRGSGLEATVGIVAAANAVTIERAQACLDELVDKKILILRHFLNAYSLFEGSDFNIEEELGKAVANIDAITPAIINSSLKLNPVIARRHYLETGTLRWFDKVIATPDHLEELLKRGGTEGQLLLCIPGRSETEDELRAFVTESIPKLSMDSLTFIGVAHQSNRIRDLAKDLEGLKQVMKDPRLEGDPTAKRELKSRLSFVTNELTELLEDAFNNADWLDKDGVKHAVTNQLQLNTLVSATCEQVFNKAPVIKNELVNRDTLSSNITSARKQLLFAMAEASGEERLGITQFPPQAMLYVTLLQQTGIHRKLETGAYGFTDPDPESSLYGIWSDTEAFVRSQPETRILDLYAHWAEAPFGLKQGVMPILALAFIFAKRNNIAIYTDGMFQPELNKDWVELFVVDPKRISLKFIENSMDQQDLLKGLQESLTAIGERNVENSALSVSRAIVRIVLTCPKWALTTNDRRFSPKTIAFRNVVIKAADPIKLIYEDLASVFGTEDVKTLVHDTIQALTEIRSFMPDMLASMRAFLYKALDSDGNLETLHARAKTIQSKAGWSSINAFVARIAALNESDASIEGIISLCVGKMKGQWTDHDIEAARNKIAEWGLSFRHQESLAVLKDMEGGRRLISFVVGGTEDHGEAVVDLPLQASPEVSEYKSKLTGISEDVPDDVKLAALIELSMELLKRRKNG